VKHQIPSQIQERNAAWRRRGYQELMRKSALGTAPLRSKRTEYASTVTPKNRERPSSAVRVFGLAFNGIAYKVAASFPVQFLATIFSFPPGTFPFSAVGGFRRTPFLSLLSSFQLTCGRARVRMCR